MSLNAPSPSLRTGGRWDPAAYAANAGFVPALGAPVLALLAPRPGERILDLGCGDGVLTERIAAAGAEVLGVDGSAAMVAAAQARGLDVQVGDGQALAFDAAFDAVFANAALHWMLDAAAVARGVFAALKPGGRFVGEMGGDGNIAVLRRTLREEIAAMGFIPPPSDPQWYPTVAAFTAVYRDAGFEAVDARLIVRPTPLATGAAAWFRTFRAGFLDAADVPEDRRDELARAAGRRVEAILPKDEAGVPLADYVRLRFQMRKPD